MEELGGKIWGSTLVADGKVYVGTERCEFWVFVPNKQVRGLTIKSEELDFFYN